MLMPMLWKVPMRSDPVVPSASALRSAFAARSDATIRSAWRSSSSPASVGSTRLRPRGRSSRRAPTARSSAAICWLTADCV